MTLCLAYPVKTNLLLYKESRSSQYPQGENETDRENFFTIHIIMKVKFDRNFIIHKRQIRQEPN